MHIVFYQRWQYSLSLAHRWNTFTRTRICLHLFFISKHQCQWLEEPTVNHKSHHNQVITEFFSTYMTHPRITAGSAHILSTKSLLPKYTGSQYILAPLEFCCNLGWILLLPRPLSQISLTGLRARASPLTYLNGNTDPLTSRCLLWAWCCLTFKTWKMPRTFSSLYISPNPRAHQVTNNWNCTHAWLILFPSSITDFSWDYFLHNPRLRVCISEKPT